MRQGHSATRAATRAAACLALLAGVAGCANVREAAGNIWPFGREPGDAVKADDGRIAVLALEQQLTVDPALAEKPVVVPAATAFPDWPSPGGTTTNAPQHVQGDGQLSVLFKRKIGAEPGDRGALIAPPVVAGGRVYLLDADLVVQAVDAESGRSVWRRNVARAATRARGAGRSIFRPASFLPGGRDGALGGGLSVLDGRLFVATGHGDVVALSLADGAEAWRTDVGVPIHAAPLAASGRVWVTSNDSELYALDAATGTVQWTQSAIAEPARMLAAPSPALVGDTLVAPFASGEIIAMVAANGRRLWSEGLTRQGALTSLSAINDIAGRPAVAGGSVFAASQSGVLAAVDLRTGIRVWDKPISSIQTPWVAGDFVFAVSTQGELVCLDRATGGVRWLVNLPRFENADKRKGLIAWTGPVLVGGQLVLGNSRGEVAMVRPEDGATVSTLRVGSPLFIPPAVANGTVYFLSNDAELIALR